MYEELSAYVTAGEVTALEHELRDHTVELGALVSEAFLAGAQSPAMASVGSPEQRARRVALT